jgi:hypothetical protein
MIYPLKTVSLGLRIIYIAALLSTVVFGLSLFALLTMTSSMLGLITVLTVITVSFDLIGRFLCLFMPVPMAGKAYLQISFVLSIGLLALTMNPDILTGLIDSLPVNVLINYVAVISLVAQFFASALSVISSVLFLLFLQKLEKYLLGSAELVEGVQAILKILVQIAIVALVSFGAFWFMSAMGSPPLGLLLLVIGSVILLILASSMLLRYLQLLSGLRVATAAYAVALT